MPASPRRWRPQPGDTLQVRGRRWRSTGSRRARCPGFGGGRPGRRDGRPPSRLRGPRRSCTRGCCTCGPTCPTPSKRAGASRNRFSAGRRTPPGGPATCHRPAVDRAGAGRGRLGLPSRSGLRAVGAARQLPVGGRAARTSRQGAPRGGPAARGPAQPPSAAASRVQAALATAGIRRATTRRGSNGRSGRPTWPDRWARVPRRAAR